MKNVVFYRRKREGRTDYVRRLALLKSRLPRLVIRKTNKHTILQVVEYDADGDKIVATLTTEHLTGQGWKGATGNSAAAYLAGKLLAKKLAKFDKELVVDSGLHVHKAQSRIYAAVRGVIDGGLKVKCNKEVLTDDARLSGDHLSDNVKKQFTSLNEKL